MNDWINWNGGECPVPEGTLVDVKHRDGHEYCGVPAGMPVRAETWTHSDDEHPGDIVAYRVSKEQPANHKNYLATLPLVAALWWFIENIGEDHADRNDLFFYLRERVRQHDEDEAT